MADSVSKWAGLAGIAVTAGTLIWQMSGIAHDVGEVRVAVTDLRTTEKGTDERLYALESRVVKLETSVSLMEKSE
ncbi:hypothetical protein SAMN02787142_1258 [Burkholderia sp. WP9]|uniref:hypothetical protein n=1 Tax=Burkholderiaceae TaxID=119060 RepID=UPI00089B43EB|nr:MULTISPECIES: hypothetical protein [Burkholderiaceae]MBK3741186.1 hypothetical protein [Paraburkholderia aspalathi]CAE6746828.1 hypothetical protein R69619_02738 [Paraburkholderia nemoris]SEC36246.1 hypothetical protein SAMN02787142_1258 [Burkholderia sp. WP9]